jgi:hypothetical protein
MLKKDPEISPSQEVLATVIPYRNPPALTSYYLGLFSIIGFVPIIGLIGTMMGIAAFILGIKGLKRAKSSPGAKGKVHAWIGILCGGAGAVLTGLFNATFIYVMIMHPGPNVRDRVPGRRSVRQGLSETAGYPTQSSIVHRAPTTGAAHE